MAPIAARTTPRSGSSGGSDGLAAMGIDEDTRRLLLKKTWCHGQLVLPVWSIVVFFWYLRGMSGDNDYSVGRQHILWIPIVVFPCWFYVSYRSVFSDYSRQQLAIGGIAVQLSHAIVLVVSTTGPKSLKDDTWNMIMCIVSVLFLIETSAFLCVVTTCRPPTSSMQQQQQLLPT